MRQQFEVAERVREVIGRAGCTQREFARRVVMDPSKLSRSLSGSRRFTVAELARIADAGNVDAGWLLGTAPTGGAADTPRPSAPAALPDSGRPLQIVRETVRLIAERGFHAVRVADIAAACDTSTATIHYHFPGRAELLEAAVRWCMDEDTARRAARTATADDAREELRQLIALQAPYTERQRQQWLVWMDLWAEAARSTAIGRLHADFYQQWRQTVAEVIRRGIEQGVFRAVDPEFSALRLTALIDGLAIQVLATTPGEGGTTAEAMDLACNAYVDSELTVRPTVGTTTRPSARSTAQPTARRSGADEAGPPDRPGP
ncbi:TetR family transcriptional regulator C-terminal domain-containing protein [Streptomyces sp. 4503]|uniref:TetR family transcriptional regulator C-terminal domain-containing protein n=1 Tax=Streptomyces niphimycinicus TaxID=2842201 RepID=A0ABS6CAS8_9ACTN|nr:TetR/AcrR family transcriptional regulator [Streptomyces niphimycinicus]MBU3864009.1 TetR family transcriptional regulator C-terminal domain-containing protein [Streptomyces niphimycinicus]